MLELFQKCEPPVIVGFLRFPKSFNDKENWCPAADDLCTPQLMAWDAPNSQHPKWPVKVTIASLVGFRGGFRMASQESLRKQPSTRAPTRGGIGSGRDMYRNQNKKDGEPKKEQNMMQDVILTIYENEI